jgi:hypothetical protein
MIYNYIAIYGISLVCAFTIKTNNQMEITLTIVYLLVFVVVFWLFFKTVNYFEKI